MKDITTLDLSAFPIVKGRSTGLSEGYSATWIDEMENLLGGGRPFVLLYGEARSDEAHSDQKARGLWLKANRARLSVLCRGVVSVEEDPSLRAKRQAQGAGLRTAFGINMLVAANAEEAMAIADRLLAAQA